MNQKSLLSSKKLLDKRYHALSGPPSKYPRRTLCREESIFVSRYVLRIFVASSSPDNQTRLVVVYRFAFVYLMLLDLHSLWSCLFLSLL